MRSHAYAVAADHHHAHDEDVGDVEHVHDHGDGLHSHGHSHLLVDRSIIRSRDGVRTVAISLGVLALTAALQAAIFLVSGSIALLADLVHNVGDALTAVPLGIAFALRSQAAERYAGYAVVLAILVSACVAGYEAVVRLLEPDAPQRLAALAAAGLIGFGGNMAAAAIRIAGGRRLASAALVADGNHARADAYVSLGVVGSAIAVWLGAEIADPLIGLAITLVILQITWQSFRTIRRGHQ